MYPLAVGPKPYRLKAIAQCIWFFIKNSVWLPTSEGKNGSSWIELFARYQLLGGKASLHRSNGALPIPDSFKVQLSTFTSVFRRIVAMYVAPTDAMIFRPAHDKNWRLKSYGVGQHVPCISAQLCVSQSMLPPMHEALACLIKPVKRTSLSDLRQGLYQVELRRMSKRGPPPGKRFLTGLVAKPWRRTLPTMGTPSRCNSCLGRLVSSSCVVLASIHATLPELIL